MQAVIDFILELDELKRVTRRTKPIGLDRYENSAEHSWQIAMLTLALAPHAPGIDVEHAVLLLLVHDVGEIDTGDTFFFAEGHSAQKVDERAAVERIFGLLPSPTRERLLGLWVEFDANLTHEARFANAIDRAMPALLNLANDGGSWRENGVGYEQVIARVGPPVEAGCRALWAHLRARLDEANARGWFPRGGTRP